MQRAAHGHRRSSDQASGRTQPALGAQRRRGRHRLRALPAVFGAEPTARSRRDRRRWSSSAWVGACATLTALALVGVPSPPPAAHADEESEPEGSARWYELWNPGSDVVLLAVVPDAAACALPEGAEGPGGEQSRGVRLFGGGEFTSSAGDPNISFEMSQDEYSVFYADPDDLLVMFDRPGYRFPDEPSQSMPYRDFTASIECLSPEGDWERVASQFLAPPFAYFEPTHTVDPVDPVIRDGILPIVPDGRDVLEVEIDGDPVTLDAAGDGFALPPDLEPGSHLLTVPGYSLSSTDPIIGEGLEFPFINGYAAPPAAPEPEPVSGDGDGIPLLSELRTDPATLFTALAVAAALGGTVWLLLGFPSDIFNKALEGNRGRPRAWRRRLRALLQAGVLGRALFSRRALAAFLVFWGLSAALPVWSGWKDPPEGTPLLDFLGLLIAVLAVTVLYAWVVHARDWSWSQVPGRFEVLPAGLAIVAVCSAASAAADFEPGYFYGLIAGFTAVADRGAKLGMPDSARDAFVREHEGRATLTGALCVLALAVACYLFWNSLHPVVVEGGAPFGARLLDKALSSTALLGIQTVVFGLLPMKFLDGHRLWRWGRLRWALAFVPGAFVFVYLLHMHPDEVAGKTEPESFLATAALFVGFGVLSLAVWAFFVWRARRTAAAPHRSSAATATPPVRPGPPVSDRGSLDRTDEGAPPESPELPSAEQSADSAAVEASVGDGETGEGSEDRTGETVQDGRPAECTESASADPSERGESASAEEGGSPPAGTAPKGISADVQASPAGSPDSAPEGVVPTPENHSHQT
ncbi:hypothetical protein BJF83_08775 [Nocardiopsis sp. CNR-923]|uniref:FGLLP motif-containing membrane protein n=1 Tax=Nocardiopsis sp. CNR-923 TaxID=1904965 RepID=UPI000969F805|nr:FGLLP motif-containing membrane protein [Nocardiopsis sp. CNR-923]OLT30373.1 hypothetical protein BJF83_08775 [Nocardiopsis sp. CNR-923]